MLEATVQWLSSSISLVYTGSDPLELFNVRNVNADGEDDRSFTARTIALLRQKSSHQISLISSPRFLGQSFWEWLSTTSNCAGVLVGRLLSPMWSLLSLQILAMGAMVATEVFKQTLIDPCHHWCRYYSCDDHRCWCNAMIKNSNDYLKGMGVTTGTQMSSAATIRLSESSGRRHHLAN